MSKSRAILVLTVVFLSFVGFSQSSRAELHFSSQPRIYAGQSKPLSLQGLRQLQSWQKRTAFKEVRTKEKALSGYSFSRSQQALMISSGDNLSLVWIPALVLISGWSLFGVVELASMAAMIFSDNKEYWSRFNKSLFLGGSITSGILLGAVGIYTLNEGTASAPILGAAGVLFGLHLLGYLYSKSVHEKSARMSPWVAPTNDGGISGGLAFSGNF